MRRREIDDKLQEERDASNSEWALKKRAAEFGDDVSRACAEFPQLERDKIELILKESLEEMDWLGEDGRVDMKKTKALIRERRGNEQLAQALIHEGKAKFVGDRIRSFYHLSNETARLLLAAGEAPAISYHIDRFYGLNRDMIIELIEAGGAVRMSNNRHFGQLTSMGVCPPFDTEVFMRLIEADVNTYQLAVHIYHTEGLDYNALLKEYIDRGRADGASYILNKCERPSEFYLVGALRECADEFMSHVKIEEIRRIGTEELAHALIESGHGDILVDHISSFAELDLNELIPMLTRTGHYDSAQRLIDALPSEELTDVFDQLADSGRLDSHVQFEPALDPEAPDS